jgi:hypothetical protein
MSQLSFFPYQFAAGALTLDCRVDGVETERTPSGALLFLEELGPESAIHLYLSIGLSPGTIERVVPAHEHERAPWSVGVVIRSVPGRLRRLVHVTPESSDGFQCKVDFRRADLHQQLVATPVLFRTSQGTGESGFATHRASRRGADAARGRRSPRASSTADLTPRMSPLDRRCVSWRQQIDQAEARFGAFFVVRSPGGDIGPRSCAGCAGR